MSDDAATPPKPANLPALLPKSGLAQAPGAIPIPTDIYLVPAPIAASGAIVGRTPAEAAARMRRSRRGNVLPEGMTIHDLMTYGRA